MRRLSGHNSILKGLSKISSSLAKAANSPSSQYGASFNASQVTGIIPATPAMIVSFLPAVII